jgi:hypothetical protein
MTLPFALRSHTPPHRLLLSRQIPSFNFTTNPSHPTSRVSTRHSRLFPAASPTRAPIRACRRAKTASPLISIGSARSSFHAVTTSPQASKRVLKLPFKPPSLAKPAPTRASRLYQTCPSLPLRRQSSSVPIPSYRAPPSSPSRASPTPHSSPPHPPT